MCCLKFVSVVHEDATIENRENRKLNNKTEKQNDNLSTRRVQARGRKQVGQREKSDIEEDVVERSERGD